MGFDLGDPLLAQVVRSERKLLHLVVNAQGPDDFLDSSETGRGIVRGLVPLYLLLFQAEAFSQLFLAQSSGDPGFDLSQIFSERLGKNGKAFSIGYFTQALIKRHKALSCCEPLTPQDGGGQLQRIRCPQRMHG